MKPGAGLGTRARVQSVLSMAYYRAWTMGLSGDAGPDAKFILGSVQIRSILPFHSGPKLTRTNQNSSSVQIPWSQVHAVEHQVYYVPFKTILVSIGVFQVPDGHSSGLSGVAAFCVYLPGVRCLTLVLFLSARPILNSLGLAF
jgi:hypothetical protein